MPKTTDRFFFIFLCSILFSCGPGGNLTSFNTAPGFPSDADQSGGDALSSSTNRKPGAEAPDAQAVPWAGAAFIKTPAVNNYGTVSFSYPLEVPEGRAGLTPELSLSCSSAKGDGLCGVGWTLSAGGGAITRTARSGQPVYGPGDIFTYNGKRLLKTSPGSGEDGSYRFEAGGDLSLFTLSDSAEGGVWTLRDTSGRVSIFGEDHSSRIYPPHDRTKTFCWNFSLCQDLNGNYVRAVYDEAEFEKNRVLYLKELRYTGHEPTGTEPRQWIRLSFRDRSEPFVSSVPGFITRMTRLLDGITIGWEGPSGSEELWSYRMVYDESPESNRPRLVTVESDRTDTSPAFEYGKASHSLLWKQAENNSPMPAEKAARVRYFEGDFNGDALSDMVFFDPETGIWKAAEARRGGGYNFPLYAQGYRGYDSPDEIQFFKGNVTGDFNGDGRSDIAFYLPGTRDFIVAEHNGRAFEFRSYGRMISGAPDIMSCEWFTGDYDSNGLSDCLLFCEKTGNWTLMLNMGRRFEFIVVSRRFRNIFRQDYKPDSSLNCEMTFDASEAGLSRSSVYFFTGDYTGNGRTDISVYDSRSGAWYVGESSGNAGSGFFINWRLYRSFAAPENILFSNDRFCGDFNSDGLSDFMLFDRTSGLWTLGETGEGTINFRTFSRSPQFRDITRFIQGDFNGDGRTDIGFFSKADNKVWVGESFPGGFNYRIYSSLEYGPDSEVVLAAPLPEEEVVIGSAIGIVPGREKTSLINYSYDSNSQPGRGESAFPGSFTSAGAPEVLFWRKASAGDLKAGFHLQRGPSSAEYLGGPGIDLSSVTMLNQGRPLESGGRDSLVFYESSGDVRRFRTLSVENSALKINTVAEFGEEDMHSFDVSSSVCLTGKFRAPEASEAELLILDNFGENEPSLRLYTGGADFIRFNIADGSLSGSDFRDTKGLCFFTVCSVSSAESPLILVCDTREEEHRWHAARIEESIYSAGVEAVTFYECVSDFQLDSGFAGEFYPCPGGFWLRAGQRLSYISVNDAAGFTELRRLGSYSVAEGQEFRGEFDHTGSPILRNGRELFRIAGFKAESIPIAENSEYASLEFKRPELYREFYPYQWIQGDYNGDGKTDIGIFSVTDESWHFALTEGTVPDLPVRVHNGIGGIYSFQYANSSGFDNTGGDGIPDLPVNYKVCTGMRVSDGRGNEVKTAYSYRGGYAFSDFIDGFRESDFFGFSSFTVTDALGGKHTSLYHNTPYADFLWNRALAGAVRSTVFTGADGVEYRREDYSYRIHEIGESGQSRRTCIAETSRIDTFRDRVLFESAESEMCFAEAGYKLVSKTGRNIDRFADGVHSQNTDTAYTEFETDETTNACVIKLKKDHAGGECEVTTRFDYDFNFNPINEETEYTGGVLEAPESRRVQREYDIFGNVSSETDRSGSPERKTSFEYDGELHQFVSSKTVFAPKPLTTHYATDYGSAFGKPAEISSPGGKREYISYDSQGRICSRSEIIGGEKRKLSEYLYRHRSFPLSACVTLFTGTGDPDIRKAVYGDGCGRVIHSVRSASQGRFARSGRIIYDALGREIRKSRSSWCGGDELESFHPQLEEVNPTITEYDYAGRSARVTLPASSPEGKPYSTERQYVYGNPWTVTERSGRRGRTSVSNSRGLKLYVTDFGTGDDGESLSSAMGFAYDSAGRRVKRMDLNSSPMNAAVDPSLFRSDARESSGSCTSQWRYDGFGRLTDISCPDTGYTRLEYNAFGDNSAVVDARGLRTEISYDSLGRVSERRAPSFSGDEVETTRFIYDALSGRPNLDGRLAAVEGPGEIKEFFYDEAGRVVREKRVFRDTAVSTGSSLSFSTGFSYDDAGRITEVDYPPDPRCAAGIRAQYSYGADGAEYVRVISGSRERELIRSVSYNEEAQIETLARGNGTESAYSYDCRGRLVAIVSTTESNAVTRKLEDVSYTLRDDNSVAGITGFAELHPGGVGESKITHCFTYDGLNRLVTAGGELLINGSSPDAGRTVNGEEERKYSESFTYSANGNMASRSVSDYGPGGMKQSVMNYSYAGGNHALTGISSEAGDSLMRYDAAGNMVYQSGASGEAKRIEFDAFNRVRRVVDDSSGIAAGVYQYDADGLRTRKLVTDVEGRGPRTEVLSPSIYFALEQSVPDGAHDSPGALCSVNHVYLNGVRVAAVAANGDARFYLTDHVDSVKIVVDDNGLPVSQHEYLPFGGSWFSRGAERHCPKFNSQELDRGSGLIFFNARHYDADICRFVTADSVVPYGDDTQSWNRYSYCRNNPVMYGDPSGNFDELLYTSQYENQGVLHEFSVNGGLVEKGDTLWAIAKDQIESELGKAKTSSGRIHSRIGFIKKANGLSSDLIKPGQLLVTGAKDHYISEKGLEEPFIDPVGLAVGGVSGLKGLVKNASSAIKNNKLLGKNVYRIFGGESKPFGHSWTIKNPKKMINPRNSLGLPNVNDGRFIIEGKINNTKGIIIRKALPLDNNKGGAIEILIPEPKTQIFMKRISGINPEY